MFLGMTNQPYARAAPAYTHTTITIKRRRVAKAPAKLNRKTLLKASAKAQRYKKSLAAWMNHAMNLGI